MNCFTSYLLFACYKVYHIIRRSQIFGANSQEARTRAGYKPTVKFGRFANRMGPTPAS
jgi:hypothetical protein